MMSETKISKKAVDVLTDCKPYDGDPCGCIYCADSEATLWCKGEPWCDACHDRAMIAALRAALDEAEARATHWHEGWQRAMGEFDAKCKEANEQRARAVKAEAERDEWKDAATKHHPNPADHRYWEGRYRDEKAERDAANALLREGMLAVQKGRNEPLVIWSETVAAHLGAKP